MYLELARAVFKTENRLILNPRAIDVTSLEYADSVWVADLSRYINEHDYQERRLKQS